MKKLNRVKSIKLGANKISVAKVSDKGIIFNIKTPEYKRKLHVALSPEQLINLIELLKDYRRDVERCSSNFKYEPINDITFKERMYTQIIREETEPSFKYLFEKDAKIELIIVHRYQANIILSSSANDNIFSHTFSMHYDGLVLDNCIKLLSELCFEIF